MATTIEKLKEYFATGKKPDGNQFEELIDAFVHRDDNVGNIASRIAEESEAQEGIVTDKHMTPFLVFSAIKALTRLTTVTELSNEVDEKIQSAVNALIDSAPGTLDTLGEIATALSDNTTAHSSLMSAINNRYTKAQLDAFFESSSSGKKRINWDRVTGKPVRFSPTFHSHVVRVQDLVGVLGKRDSIDLYRSDFLATSLAVRRAIIEARKWVLLTGKPASFPPSEHTHTPAEVGLGNIPNEVIDDPLNSQRSDVLASALAVYRSTDWDNLRNIPAGFNPHPHTHTPAEVGLGNIPNETSDSHTESRSDQLATSKAVRDAKNFAKRWQNIGGKPEGLPIKIVAVPYHSRGESGESVLGPVAGYRIRVLKAAPTSQDKNATEWVDMLPNNRMINIQSTLVINSSHARSDQPSGQESGGL